jgi:hypothetical protein
LSDRCALAAQRSRIRGKHSIAASTICRRSS